MSENIDIRFKKLTDELAEIYFLNPTQIYLHVKNHSGDLIKKIVNIREIYLTKIAKTQQCFDNFLPFLHKIYFLTNELIYIKSVTNFTFNVNAKDIADLYMLRTKIKNDVNNLYVNYKPSNKWGIIYTIMEKLTEEKIDNLSHDECKDWNILIESLK